MSGIDGLTKKLMESAAMRVLEGLRIPGIGGIKSPRRLYCVVLAADHEDGGAARAWQDLDRATALAFAGQLRREAKLLEDAFATGKTDAMEGAGAAATKIKRAG